MNIRKLSNARNDLLENFVFNMNVFLLVCAGCVFIRPLWAGEITHTIKNVKPAIVGIGIFNKTHSPPVNFIGTGFAVGDGLNVITNAHVIPKIMDSEKKESIVIIAGRGEAKEFREAILVAIDKEHDIAQLKISGLPLPVMELGDSGSVQEGQSLAFTGFPIGMVLGFFPVTHRGMISSITPIVLPALNSTKLDMKMIKQLKKSAYEVFQLDGTAYPGSSGSPLYDPETGVVYGVISMVFVNGLKESALSQPSGITYAIPANFVRDLMQRKQP